MRNLLAVECCFHPMTAVVCMRKETLECHACRQTNAIWTNVFALLTVEHEVQDYDLHYHFGGEIWYRPDAHDADGDRMQWNYSTLTAEEHLELSKRYVCEL